MSTNMTYVCQKTIVYYFCKGDKIMFDKIINKFFIKEEKVCRKNRTTIITKKREIKFERNVKKISENVHTELSEYFIMNKGLNVNERLYYNEM